MTNLLQRGRLEVETDLLLGAEEVLLPQGALARRSPSPQREADTVQRGSPSTPPSASNRFDASLFAASPGVRSSPRPPTSSVAQVAPRALAAPVPTGEPLQPLATAPIPIEERIAAPAATTKAQRLAMLDALHARECPHCTTATGHTRLVFGEGDPDAELVFVGEAPGETEDKLGRPFVGRAGEKLDEMISAMGLRREQVYIANVLKSRPPENRTPLAHEVERCGPYLLAQLSVIRPKVIVCLGGPATKLLLATELGITRMRGAFATITLGKADGQPFDVPAMPTFHPAYLLRNYTVETRMQVWEDLKKVLGVLGRPVPSRREAATAASADPQGSERSA